VANMAGVSAVGVNSDGDDGAAERIVVVVGRLTTAA
jgi:hypothetical protein